MRTVTLFALTLVGTAVLADDARAFGKRRGNGCGGGGCSGYVDGYSGGCSGGGYVPAGHGCGGYVYGHSGGCSGYTYGGYSGGAVGYGPGTFSGWGTTTRTVGGQPGMIQATSGQTYVLGSDGHYYASPTGVPYGGGFVPQPSSSVVPASYWTPRGATPSYPTGGFAVYPAGGVPLVMPVGAPPGAPPAAGNTFRAKQILGTKIMVQNSTAAGTVEDLVFDDAGNLDYLIVSTGEGKLLTVPWDAAKFDPEKKTATLAITQDVWKTIPTYTPTTYPQFYAPAYRTDIYKVYGLTPRELRRIERRNP